MIIFISESLCFDSLHADFKGSSNVKFYEDARTKFQVVKNNNYIYYCF
jgi:hypothetical protein